MTAIYKAQNLFFTNIKPQIDKIRFVKEACSNGIFGEDSCIPDEKYKSASWGLFYILNEVVEVLEDYGTTIDQLFEESKKVSPEPLHKAG